MLYISDTVDMPIDIDIRIACRYGEGMRCVGRHLHTAWLGDGARLVFLYP